MICSASSSSAPTGAPQIAVSDVKRERGVPVLGTRALPGHTRAFLKIQEGCNYSCTYCIIPTARGLSRSVTPREVMEQVRRLAGAGYKEIVLTGIHLGGYGQDLNPKIDLTALVEMIADSGLISRLRLSSLDPREVPDRLLDLIAAAKTICPHLHICAQAGDNEILKQMRRNYDTAYYRDLLARVRTVCPTPRWAATSSSDFPARATPSLKILWSILTRCRSLIFTFSPIRRAAAPPRLSSPNHVAGPVKKARARRMRALGVRKKSEFCSSFLGRRVSVLVEEKVDGASGFRRGFSRNYLPVILPARSRFVESRSRRGAQRLARRMADAE